MVTTIRHSFSDPALLTLALTHRSAAARHNERLEFLGDAVLGLLMAEFLYARFPRADEGQLTRARATLVNRATLADLARELELGRWLSLGEGEQKSGGWRRDSILANALEAVVGAIYLDGGLDAVRTEIIHWYESRLAIVDPAEAQKDPKTLLQEFLQRYRRPLPRYRTVEEEGPPHARSFRVICELEAPALAVEARAASRRQAEQEAARQALVTLQEETGGER